MSLTKQLLAFGLLTLVLPWAGFRYVQEMEAVLRIGLEQSLLASAGTVAQALAGEEWSSTSLPGAADGTPVYARTLGSVPRIDGGRGDWNLDEAEASDLGAGVRYWTGINGRFVYLFVEIEDSDVIYQRTPGSAPYGDRMVVALVPASGSGARWLVFPTAAPGLVRPQRTEPPLFAPDGNYDDRVLAAWRETLRGFQLEVRLPAALVGSHFGLGIVDVDSANNALSATMAASWSADDAMPGAFVYQRPHLQRVISQFKSREDRFRIIDSAGWTIADSGRLHLDSGIARVRDGSLTEDIVRYLLRREDPPYGDLEAEAGRIVDPALLGVLEGTPVTVWYSGSADRSAIVVAASPVVRDGEVRGAVILEQASDSILTATNQALLSLMGFSLLAIGVAVLGLLGFATYLSVRVSRLAGAAETALGPKGEIDTHLPGRAARDELGNLARSFADLLERLRDHTEYLRTLTSKLSHELRTPLAVVSTSLDNLEREHGQESSQQYLERLREGTNRLDAILAAMSEATRMEQAIEDTRHEAFDLDRVLEACCRAYQDVYTEREFRYESGVSEAPVHGSRELIAQLMDKLVDNAVSFSPPGSLIGISLSEDAPGYRIEVVNRGSSLPEKMRRQLFDSLVSVRKNEGGSGTHLGLGLYVASLIVRFHEGRIEADNLPDGTGVVIRAFIPRLE